GLNKIFDGGWVLFLWWEECEELSVAQFTTHRMK
nr:hypothetical protein [Tanacetum cinerariifolium]